MLAVPERVRVALRMIVAAADAGEPCPSNYRIARAIDAQSRSSAADIVNFLEVAGMIRVERFRSSRIVEIVASGKRTAGKPTSKPQLYGIGSRGEPRVLKAILSSPVEIKPSLPPKTVAPSIDRSPCPRCGIRADLGCAHSERLAA